MGTHIWLGVPTRHPREDCSGDPPKLLQNPSMDGLSALILFVASFLGLHRRYSIAPSALKTSNKGLKARSITDFKTILEELSSQIFLYLLILPKLPRRLHHRAQVLRISLIDMSTAGENESAARSADFDKFPAILFNVFGASGDQ
jgi:hypothetical protein